MEHSPSSSDTDNMSLSTHGESPTTSSISSLIIDSESLSTHGDSASNCESLSTHGGSDSDSSVSCSQKRRRFSQQVQPCLSIYKQECCDSNCVMDFSPVELKELQVKFKDFGDEVSQKQFILDQIRQHSKGSTKRADSKLFVFGKPVCEKAWCSLYNVSEWRFKLCLRLFRQGVVNVAHGNLHSKRVSSKTTRSLAWMRYLFERIGDWMPHKSQVHLPTSSTKKYFYDRMVKEFEADFGLPPDNNITYEYFTEIWSKQLPEFIIPKVSAFFLL